MLFKGDNPRFILSPPLSVGKDDRKRPTFTATVYRAVISKDPAPSESTSVQGSGPEANSISKESKSPTSWALSNNPVLPLAPDVKPPLARNQNNSCPTPEPDKPPCWNLERFSLRWLLAHKHSGDDQLEPVASPSAGDAFQKVALLVMQNTLKTDVAMIQQRDLFDADSASYEQIQGYKVQDQISRILWKDDFAVKLNLTGATIRRLLKQSATFAQQDQNSLTTEIEIGRSLITLGIYKDPKNSDNYYINGMLMDDSKLYSIATTDFITGGDTGYSDLATPDVPPSTRVRDFAHARLKSISGLVCEALKSANSQPLPGVESSPDSQIPDCLETSANESYFDKTEAKPFDATPGFSTAQHWLTAYRNFTEPRRPFPNSEQKIQQRPFWYLNLENLNHVAKTTTSLEGISNPLLSNQGTTSIGADHKARFVFDYGVGTNYLLTDSAFLRNTTTTSTPALVNNLLGMEAGGTVRLPVGHYHLGLKHPRAVWPRPSWLSFQYSLRYEKQLVDPESLPVALTAGPTLLLPTPKISNIYGRAGLRVELGDTYLEAGLEKIDSRGLLSNYALTPSGRAPLYCQPGVSAALLCGPDPAPNSPLNVTPIKDKSVLLPRLSPGHSQLPVLPFLART